ncbi:hypothetical protein [Mycolicibacterium sp. CBMA 361]|nr:hypothetical protein [Mycolicibacterium sp. CBMA 361]
MAAGPKAPQYLIFETHTVYAGDTGSLAELGPGGRVVTGMQDSTTLLVDADGRFEILLAPQRPAGHIGNFIVTTSKAGDTAGYVVARVLFHDWEHEVSPDLHIAQIDSDATHPAPLTPSSTAARIRRIGDLVENQMKFWNEFYDVVLEAHGDKNGDGITFMPRNELNAPMPANLATGGGQCTNVYSGGTYDLGPDDALLIELSAPVKPAYLGFHLSNLWGESLDYANHVCSLNGFQTEPDLDGHLRYIVTGLDPGVPNWLDTAGHSQGFLTVRWTYAEPPAELPTATVTLISRDEVRKHLPETTRTVSAAERREQIRIRQQHVQRRYRQY